MFEGICEKVWRHFNANKVPFFASVFVKVDMCCFVEFKLNQNAISLDICCTNSIDFEIFEKKLAPKELSLPADSENRKKRILKNLEMCCFVKRGQHSFKYPYLLMHVPEMNSIQAHPAYYRMHKTKDMFHLQAHPILIIIKKYTIVTVIAHALIIRYKRTHALISGISACAFKRPHSNHN